MQIKFQRISKISFSSYPILYDIATSLKLTNEFNEAHPGMCGTSIGKFDIGFDTLKEVIHIQKEVVGDHNRDRDFNEKKSFSFGLSINCVEVMIDHFTLLEGKVNESIKNTLKKIMKEYEEDIFGTDIFLLTVQK